jgi:hypothetical protein
MVKKKESERSSQNSEGNKHEKNESNEEEPNFSDPEGFVDNISDEGSLCTFYFLSSCTLEWHMVSHKGKYSVVSVRGFRVRSQT